MCMQVYKRVSGQLASQDDDNDDDNNITQNNWRNKSRKLDLHMTGLNNDYCRYKHERFMSNCQRDRPLTLSRITLQYPSHQIEWRSNGTLIRVQLLEQSQQFATSFNSARRIWPIRFGLFARQIQPNTFRICRLLSLI